MDIKPIRRVTLPDEIIAQVKKLIIDGEVKPGDRLPPERELIDRFEVGRSALREAFKVLTSIGVLKRTRDGTFINDDPTAVYEVMEYSFLFRPVNVHEIFEARKLFELSVAELAAQRATDEDIRAMEEALGSSGPGADKFGESNLLFHMALAAATHNALVYRMFRAVREWQFQVRKYVEQSRGRRPGIGNEERRVDSYKQHWRILEAVRARDSILARQEVLKHLEALEATMYAYAEDESMDDAQTPS